jgi:hypothetical protein
MCNMNNIKDNTCSSHLRQDNSTSEAEKGTKIQIILQVL